MKLTFLGATQTVTGSKYLLSYDSKKILVDCGLFQGYKELRLRNWNKLPIDPKQIDAVILTHAHIDHSGYLPLLMKNGFKGPIFATKGTKDLCSIMLPDSGHIQEEDAFRANKYGYSKHKVALPLYTQLEAELVLKQFVAIDFEKPHKLDQNSYFTFFPAGHILGAAIVEINVANKKIVFSGDLGRGSDPIMDKPAIIESADYLVVESTYGNRLHEKVSPLDELKTIIQNTAKRGGTVIIPAFTVGRVQNVLYYIHQLKLKHAIPDIPVFVDSPMATKVTHLLEHFVGEHRLNKKECLTVSQTANYIDTVEESKQIDNYAFPTIIISASGMATGGRVLHHLKAFAPDPRNSIVFTGYQAGGTRGARMLNGEKEIKIHGQMVPVNAKVEILHNMSAHADYEEMLSWLSHFKHKPKSVFIIHGEVESATSLKEKIQKRLHWHCVIPTYMQTVEL
ncbi:MAG: MBL fold metallo-hydrolase RNA specificity domain-containing protein [Candidatus Berkiella sp.]